MLSYNMKISATLTHLLKNIQVEFIIIYNFDGFISGTITNSISNFVQLHCLGDIWWALGTILAA